MALTALTIRAMGIPVMVWAMDLILIIIPGHTIPTGTILTTGTVITTRIAPA
jgi:hypothetical protein